MLFTSAQQLDRRIGLSLIITTGFAVSLLCIRFLLTSRLTYSFLLWNLFLAWIPLVCVWLVSCTKRPITAWKLVWIPAFLWLLFFPNSPYLLTDLGHLARVSEWTLAPLGFDVVLILSFTLNGLLLGMVSLLLMEDIWRQHFTSRTATIFSVTSLVLSGFGMYLGRFLRWNSWDFFHRPGMLVYDLFVRIADPFHYARTWGFTALYSGFLLLIYITIRLWKKRDGTEGYFN